MQKLSNHSVDLKREKGEFKAQLAARTAEKTALEKAMLKLKTDANNTEMELRRKIVRIMFFLHLNSLYSKALN